MRLALALVAVAVAVSAAPVRAGEPPPATAVVQHTTVHGTPPDLTGRWLVLAWLDVPGGRTRTNAALWDVARRDDAVDVSVRFAALPAAQQEALDAANHDRQPWNPSRADVAALAAAWDGLAPRDPHTASVDTVIRGRDAAKEERASADVTRDAVWVIEQAQGADPNGATMSQAQTYAAREEHDHGWAGTYQTVIVAAAPFPIPVTLKGRFQLYRLDRGGLFARLADLFAGCGRR